MSANENLGQLKNSDIKIADVIGGVVKFGNKTYYKILEGVAGKHSIVSMIVLEDVVSKNKIDYSIATLEYMIKTKEFKLFLPGDDSWQDNFKANEQKNLILTSIILNNIAIKGNENLSGTKDYDNYLKAKLEAANKALERKITKYVKELYTADQNVLNDLFFSIEHLAEKIAGTIVKDHNELHKLVDTFYQLKVNDIEVVAETVDPNE